MLKNLGELIVIFLTFFLAIEQNLPEDICFYRDGEVWLYTVTHERSATMVSSTSLDFDFLKSYFI